MTDQNEIIMSAEEVYTLLGIKESTLRKYALLLTKAGYHFSKNKNGQRGYFNKDVVALKKLIDIKENPDMTLDQAAKAVVTWFNQQTITAAVTPIQHSAERHIDHNEHMENIEKKLDQQTKMLDGQNEIIKELIKRLDDQQKHLDERDRRAEQRDKILLESLRATQDQKQLLLQVAAAQEELAEARQIQAQARSNTVGRKIKQVINQIFS